ncbi:MAG: DUF481 domain-containing protein [Sulfurimonadaceae bacterium]
MKLTFIKQLLTLFLVLFMTQSFVHAEYLENATPPAKAFDWMELKSGEWLKGEFKGIYSGEVEFDSDEFDLVKFELVDVKQIITKGYSTINLNREMRIVALYNGTTSDDNDGVIAGKLKYSNNEFAITLPDGSTKILQTEQIASIAGGEPKESNYWSASLFIGLDVITGNSEQVTMTAKANIQRRTAATRFMAEYLGAYTQVDGNKTTADNNRISGSFDIYQTAHLYMRAGALQYLRDPFQNIADRYTVSVGIGYDIIYTPKTDWSVTLGPGYQHTNFYAVEANASSTANTPLFFFDSKFDTELTKDIDFIINYGMYYLNEESGTYIHHAEISLQTELVKDFDFDISFFWDHTQDPAAFDDGTTPKQNDYKSMIAIGYSY